MLLADDATHGDDEVVLGEGLALAPVPHLPSADRGLSGTLRNLAGDLHALFRSEVALVRAQIGELISGFAAMATGVAVGALLAVVGLTVFVLGIAAAVALWLPIWAALLLTGAAVIAIGGLIGWLTIARLAKPTDESLSATNDHASLAAAAA